MDSLPGFHLPILAFHIYASMFTSLDYRLKVKAVLLNSTLFNLSIEQN